MFKTIKINDNNKQEVYMYEIAVIFSYVAVCCNIHLTQMFFINVLSLSDY